MRGRARVVSVSVAVLVVAVACGAAVMLRSQKDSGETTRGQAGSGLAVATSGSNPAAPKVGISARPATVKDAGPDDDVAVTGQQTHPRAGGVQKLPASTGACESIAAFVDGRVPEGTTLIDASGTLGEFDCTWSSDAQVLGIPTGLRVLTGRPATPVVTALDAYVRQLSTAGAPVRRVRIDGGTAEVQQTADTAMVVLRTTNRVTAVIVDRWPGMDEKTKRAAALDIAVGVLPIVKRL